MDISSAWRVGASFLLGLLLSVLLAAPVVAQVTQTPQATDVSSPRNIIFMVPDGMGLSNVTAARTYLGGPDGPPLSLETLPYIGYQRTHCRNSFVTDSAAAASAWACGEKFNLGEISCHDNDQDGICDVPVDSIVDIAQKRGLAVGLVATSDITQATPAGFGAHVNDRTCETEIFRQLYTRDLDVLLGGGINTNHGSCDLDRTRDSDNEELVAEAQKSHGYTLVTTREQLAAVDAAHTRKLLGLFRTRGGLTPHYRRAVDNAEPDLSQMAVKALDILDNNPKGFFLMIEGSKVDWANHARNLPYMLGEMLDFDAAVRAVRDWIAADPARQAQTLLIVAPDHECGGVCLVGPDGSQAEAGDSEEQARYNSVENIDGDMARPGKRMVTDDDRPVMAPRIEAAYGSNFEKYKEQAQHTAGDTLIWSNRAYLAKALDNTDLFYVMKKFMAGTLD